MISCPDQFKTVATTCARRLTSFATGSLFGEVFSLILLESARAAGLHDVCKARMPIIAFQPIHPNREQRDFRRQQLSGEITNLIWGAFRIVISASRMRRNQDSGAVDRQPQAQIHFVRFGKPVLWTLHADRRSDPQEVKPSPAIYFQPSAGRQKISRKSSTANRGTELVDLR